MKTKLPNPEHLYDHELQVYFKYEKLDTSELIEVLGNINQLYKKILSLSSPVYVHDDEASETSWR